MIEILKCFETGQVGSKTRVGCWIIKKKKKKQTRLGLYCTLHVRFTLDEYKFIGVYRQHISRNEMDNEYIHSAAFTILLLLHAVCVDCVELLSTINVFHKLLNNIKHKYNTIMMPEQTLSDNKTRV